MSSEIVRLEGVSKAYRMGSTYVWALKNATLSVEKGEFVAIVGPSGSGKSTLLYILGGLIRPTHGSVYVNGVDITRLSDDELCEFRHWNIGFVFQFYYLIPRMTALKNVMLPLKLRNVPVKEARRMALEALRMVGLEHRANHRPFELSGGEQQRVAIARAIVTSPRVLLADEPTGNVDRKSALQIMDLFRRLNKELGVTIVMVTHNLELIGYCDRAVRLMDGRIVKVYTPDQYGMLIRDMVRGEAGEPREQTAGEREGPAAKQP